MVGSLASFIHTPQKRNGTNVTEKMASRRRRSDEAHSWRRRAAFELSTNGLFLNFDFSSPPAIGQIATYGVLYLPGAGVILTDTPIGGASVTATAVGESGATATLLITSFTGMFLLARCLRRHGLGLCLPSDQGVTPPA